MQYRNRTSFVIAGSFGLLLCSCFRGHPSVPGAPPTTLPVYEVTESGASASEVRGLTESLHVPAGSLAVEHGVVSYVNGPEYSVCRAVR